MKNDYHSSFRPLLNGLVIVLSSNNFLSLSLEQDDLVRIAIRLAASDDFGGDDWEQPLKLLLEGYNGSAKLTELGRIIARRLVLGMLVNRLRTMRIFDESFSD